MQIPADVVTWRIVVSALSFACITLAAILYKFFIERFNRMENKIDGIIMYLILHSEGKEKADLVRLVGR